VKTASHTTPRCQQLSLPLFDPPSFDELLAERKSTTLSVSTSSRIKRPSWYVKIDPGAPGRSLVVPRFLADAPREVKEALIEWALMPDPRRSRRKAELRRRKKELETVVFAYAERSGIEHTRSRPLDPGTFRTRGCRYDLREVFDYLNTQFFNNAVVSHVRWGLPSSCTSTQTHRTGPDGARYSLITIAGAYDSKSVPRYAIEGIMFHEMLHVTVPTVVRNGRRQVHGREFRLAERRYPHLEKWLRWEKRYLRPLGRRGKRSR
jgi:hypothetical protein